MKFGEGVQDGFFKLEYHSIQLDSYEEGDLLWMGGEEGEGEEARPESGEESGSGEEEVSKDIVVDQIESVEIIITKTLSIIPFTRFQSFGKK